MRGEKYFLKAQPHSKKEYFLRHEYMREKMFFKQFVDADFRDLHSSPDSATHYLLCDFGQITCLFCLLFPYL